jgi:excisionase family DNA binding protein
MNLADAIRQAALRQAEEQDPKENPTMPANEHSVASEQPHAAAPQPETSATPEPEGNASAPAEKPAEPVETPAAPQPMPHWGTETGKLTLNAPLEEASALFATDSGTGEPVSMPESFGGAATGNAVRFEIFLSPEQLSCLFRALVATKHSMMTLREAASYLRIPASTLEQLAADGKIPALQLEGRWRFPKSGVDEWVMLQSFKDGEVGDAA